MTINIFSSYYLFKDIIKGLNRSEKPDENISGGIPAAIAVFILSTDLLVLPLA